MAHLIFLILAAICFGLAAFHVPGPVDWTNAGYCCVVIAFIV
jgi:hypothetical protein